LDISFDVTVWECLYFYLYQWVYTNRKYKYKNQPPTVHWGTGIIVPSVRVKWVPHYHGMVHLRVSDGWNGLQIWNIAVNILNRELWTANRLWSSRLVTGWGANNSSLWKEACYIALHGASDLDLLEWLRNRK
jgi:hypothetical protein